MYDYIKAPVMIFHMVMKLTEINTGVFIWLRKANKIIKGKIYTIVPLTQGRCQSSWITARIAFVYIFYLEVSQ